MSCHLSVHHTNFSYLSVHKSTVLNSWWNVKQQNDIPLQDLAILTVQNNTRFMLFTMTSNTVLKEGMAGLPRSFKLCRTIRTHTHIHTRTYGTISTWPWPSSTIPPQQFCLLTLPSVPYYSLPLSHVRIILRLGEMCTMCEKYPVCTVCTGSQRYTIQWYVHGLRPAPGITYVKLLDFAFAAVQYHVEIQHL